MAGNECSLEDRLEIVKLIPQRPPFRFLDEVLELSDSHIVSTYLFTGRESFYHGHFPGDPVTPGVILIETMAQAALVALGIHILRRENPDKKLRTLFSECAVEFFSVVTPGTRVFVHGEKVYWRRNKLQSRVELRLEDGTVAAAGTVAGLGVTIE
ncbi:MAG: beta-hydroxyacyl-ACP dehydratase [Deltaproteobacteria bacterium]|nr:beta-hydroxyacyl-ACP dehydratase [Deltaproteobacteria bacterium]